MQRIVLLREEVDGLVHKTTEDLDSLGEKAGNYIFYLIYYRYYTTVHKCTSIILLYLPYCIVTCIYCYHHYTNLTFVCDVRDVCESGRSREGHLTRAKNVSLSSTLDLDIMCSSSLTQLAMVLTAT